MDLEEVKKHVNNYTIYDLEKLHGFVENKLTIKIIDDDDDYANFFTKKFRSKFNIFRNEVQLNETRLKFITCSLRRDDQNIYCGGWKTIFTLSNKQNCVLISYTSPSRFVKDSIFSIDNEILTTNIFDFESSFYDFVNINSDLLKIKAKLLYNKEDVHIDLCKLILDVLKETKNNIGYSSIKIK